VLTGQGVPDQERENCQFEERPERSVVDLSPDERESPQSQRADRVGHPPRRMFMTAYGALIADAQVTKGDFVIIPAASSSTGLAAIQITNYAGATPIALTRTSTKKSS
jgi:NADPH-dependent curcumin reductase CurA